MEKASSCFPSASALVWQILVTLHIGCIKQTLLMALAAIRGAEQHVSSSLGFSFLPNYASTCRRRELNQRDAGWPLLLIYPLPEYLRGSFLVTPCQSSPLWPTRGVWQCLYLQRSHPPPSSLHLYFLIVLVFCSSGCFLPSAFLETDKLTVAFNSQV